MSVLKYITPILAGILINIGLLKAQNNISGVKHFDTSTFGAATQNWSVSASAGGTIYFANHRGLLEFDGTTWQLHELPNQTILRAVKVISDSLIFTSGYQELGYWKPDKYGKLQYFSLTSKARKFFSKNIEFWNIVSSKNTVYFQSFIGVLSYDSDSVKTVFKGPVSVINNINGKVLIAISNKGIFEIIDNQIVPLIESNFFNGKLVRFLLPYKNNELLIGTASNGLYVFSDNKIKPWKPELKDYFIKNELNRGFYTPGGELILGTIIDGIVVFDKNENITRKVNAESGLLNNTVLGITSDKWENIWLSLDDGIGFVAKHADQSFSIEKIPDVGAIYSTAIFNGKTYLGTNQGLFLKNDDNTTKLIAGTQGQVWDCKVINGKLWVGHNLGTFIVDGEKATLVSTTSGGFAFAHDNNKNRLIQSTYTSLVVFEPDKNKQPKSWLIDNFYDLIRYIEIDHLGNIWASHMHLGVFKIVTDDERKKATNVTYFGKNVFGKENDIHVFKVENRIVFTSNEKIFTYDDLHDTIVPFDALNVQIGKFVTSHRIIKAPNHNYWFICKEGVGLFHFDKDKISLIKEYPATLFAEAPLIDRFENILPLSDKKAILCLQNGIANLDASVSDSLLIIKKSTPALRKIELESNNGKSILLPLNQTGFEIKYNYNNLKARVSFPLISGMPISYQYFLEGLNPGWSAKTSNPEFVFERLPSAKYTLKIKAVDVWGNESRILEIPFKVLPPWYLSPIAFLIYFVFTVFILFVFRNWGIRQTRKKEQLQHEKREKELIKLRNEKLKNEVEYKSKELANTTLAIIKKNEFLLDLKKSIEKQKLELGTRYPDKYFNHLNNKIDQNISNQDDWQVFETNFEQAHEQFFSKIKASYPELTSNDLRLCAYLRMNLSSKEIAPLLGVSVRGVENHRYRLRKKMALQHDESLTHTIHSI